MAFDPSTGLPVYVVQPQAPSALSPAPETIRVSGAGLWWCNDTWTRKNGNEVRDGHPVWRRNGNKVDCLAWSVSRGAWSLSGTLHAGDEDVYLAPAGDTPLPPKVGWQPRSHASGSFGSWATPAPTLDYQGGDAMPVPMPMPMYAEYDPTTGMPSAAPLGAAMAPDQENAMASKPQVKEMGLFLLNG